jgi:putative ABC transport system ATP-binding protein
MAVAPPHRKPSSRTLTVTPYPSLRPRLRGGEAGARTLVLNPTPAAVCAFCLRATASDSPRLPKPSTVAEVFPYVAAEWETIAKGWACAAAAVFCLSRAVPAAGRLPRALAAYGSSGGATAEVVARAGLALAVFASVRAAATYAQQALLWEAALQATGRLRGRAFERLLERDLAFFEGRGGVAAGDIAHRIADESDDVADAVYSVLNVRFPGACCISSFISLSVDSLD